MVERTLNVQLEIVEIIQSAFEVCKANWVCREHKCLSLRFYGPLTIFGQVISITILGCVKGHG